MHGVVVTGVGVLTAFGRGLDPLAEGLRNDRSAIGPLQAFDAGGLPITRAAEVRVPMDSPPGFDDDRKAALALAAARDCAEGVDVSGAGVSLF